MKNPSEEPGLPPAVRQKLDEIRQEDRRVRFQTGLRLALAVLLTTMAAAMMIDWLAGLHNKAWRWTLTCLALVGPALVVVWRCLPPLLKTRSLTSIARDVDRAHPGMEERFITLVGHAESKDAAELRGSGALLEKVGQQAVEMGAKVTLDSVVSKVALVRASRFLIGAAVVFLLLFVVNFSQTKALFLRFWAPGANITLTRLTATPGDSVVGKGDEVTLEIATQGKAAKDVELTIRTASGDETVSLKPDTADGKKFSYTMDAVADSFQYRASAGDGQTPWQSIKVAERPRLAQVKMRIVPPAYSHLPVMEKGALPRNVRALEGSQMEVSLQSDQPVDGMGLKTDDGKVQPLAKSPDGTYHFTTALTNTLSFTPVFTNQQHLGNALKSSCKVDVYPDQPPTVTVTSPQNEMTAHHDDKMKIAFEARDDFGIAKAELAVTVKDGTNSTETVMPIPLSKTEAGAKVVKKEVELDLAKLKVKQNQELSYVVRVTDTKENPAQSSADQPQAQTPRSETKPSDGAKKQSPQQQAKANKPPEAGKPGEGKKQMAANQPPDQPKEPEQAKGKPAPTNNMTMRVLDAGQCSCCSPMKVIVDDWGRSFEGQARDKLEIAIDPVLRALDDSLAKAQKLVEALLSVGQSAQILGEAQLPSLHGARDDLRQADAAVSALKAKSHDTPYAFIGLQLDDIRDAHISPARKNLGDVALTPAALKEDTANLEQADFQIKSARERLASLTKTYEAVKRDNKLADAMQRLAKMHQIFLEDSQAMLGSSKPILNPQQRKTAEVSDEYADKLRKLLEEKKKIMAELAKILADDPRMLRRFMAVQQLEGTTLRDQMTLLAERQQALAKASSQWAGSAGADHPGLILTMLLTQAAEQNDVAAQTSQLLENIVTWAPLDVPADKEPIPTCRKLATEAARLAGEAASRTTPDTLTAGLASASNALEQLRTLQATLPSLDWITGSTENISGFEANRLNDTADLITKQSGWIKKIQSLRGGDYAPAAEVDQHRLMLDTTTLSEKVDAATISAGTLSSEIKAKADELNATIHREILTEESGAATALSQKTVPEAAHHQAQATNAFAKGEKQFDELLRLIIAKLDATPPPTNPGQNESLEQLLADLKDEQKACEKLGIPCRPLNVQILKDWTKPSSGSNSGSSQSQSQAQAQAKAQSRAAQSQSRQAAKKADQERAEAKRQAQQRIAALPPPERKNPDGPKPPPKSWNTLVSQLGDELRQGRDTVPPEQYRQAIEQYFSTLAEKPSEAPAPTTGK